MRPRGPKSTLGEGRVSGDDLNMNSETLSGSNWKSGTCPTLPSKVFEKQSFYPKIQLIKQTAQEIDPRIIFSSEIICRCSDGRVSRRTRIAPTSLDAMESPR